MPFARRSSRAYVQRHTSGVRISSLFQWDSRQSSLKESCLWPLPVLAWTPDIQRRENIGCTQIASVVCGPVAGRCALVPCRVAVPSRWIKAVPSEIEQYAGLLGTQPEVGQLTLTLIAGGLLTPGCNQTGTIPTSQKNWMNQGPLALKTHAGITCQPYVQGLLLHPGSMNISWRATTSACANATGRMSPGVQICIDANSERVMLFRSVLLSFVSSPAGTMQRQPGIIARTEDTPGCFAVYPHSPVHLSCSHCRFLRCHREGRQRIYSAEAVHTGRA